MAGRPTRLNDIPHSREIRTYFYDSVLQATQRAIYDGKTRLKVDINIPELNPEMERCSYENVWSFVKQIIGIYPYFSDAIWTGCL